MRNAKVHSIFFEDLPITSAAFTGVDQVRLFGVGVDIDIDIGNRTPSGKSAKLHNYCFLSTLPLA